MSNIILNADISENSSFVSNLTRISKPKTVIPSKISEPDNNVQHDKSSFVSKLTRLTPKPTVLNADMTDNSSLVSNLTRLSNPNPVLKSEPESKLSFQRSVSSSAPESKLSFQRSVARSEPESKLSFQRSVASSVPEPNSSYQQIPASSNSTTSNNYDAETASNVPSVNSTHISVYSSANSDKQSANAPINSDNKSINTPSVVTNSIRKLEDITNRVVIDVAVLCQEYTTIDTMCHDNIINLDEIPITKEVFQSIFYPYHENFGFNKDFVRNNNDITPYISFIPEFRSVNSKKFYLLEEIIANIERDLNISRNCFTKESLVELTNEIISIKSLYNINCCSVLSSLSWQNILEIIKNYQLINCDQCEKGDESKIIPICVVNIIFKTPTPGVKNTIIRFNYRITNL